MLTGYVDIVIVHFNDSTGRRISREIDATHVSWKNSLLSYELIFVVNGDVNTTNFYMKGRTHT